MKNLKILLIVSSVLIVLSCSSVQNDDMFDVPQTGYTLFEADFEDVALAGISAEKVWAKGDYIGVFGSEKGENERYYLKKAYDGRAAGEFYGPEVSGERISAYYPYSEAFALYEGELMYALSPGQTYDAEKSHLEHFETYSGYAYAFKKSGSELNFQFASGMMIVKVRTREPVAVLSVRLSSSSEPLAGLGKIDSTMTVTLSKTASKTLELVCPEDGVMSAVAGKETEFPLVMPAGRYENVSVEVVLKDKKPMGCTLDPFEIKRISVSDCIVPEVIVGINGLEGFEVSAGLEFEK